MYLHIYIYDIGLEPSAATGGEHQPLHDACWGEFTTRREMTFAMKEILSSLGFLGLLSFFGEKNSDIWRMRLFNLFRCFLEDPKWGRRFKICKKHQILDLLAQAFTFEPEPDMVVSWSLSKFGGYSFCADPKNQLTDMFGFPGNFKNGDRERKIYCNIELTDEDAAEHRLNPDMPPCHFNCLKMGYTVYPGYPEFIAF